MDNKESCPQCAGTLEHGSSRLVQDTCGHRKCRLCLLHDENSCKQCLQEAVQSNEPIACHTAVITYQKKTEKDSDLSTDIILKNYEEPKNKLKNKNCGNRNIAVNGLQKPSHVTYIEENQEFKCKICNRSFTAKSQLRYHLYCNGDKKPFECDICHKGFIAKSHYTTHLLAHQNLKPYKCNVPECGKTFYERSKLNRHQLTHATSRPFECTECGKTFKIKENLRTHSLIHQNEKPYSCIECGLKFSHSSNLKKHLTVHTSDKSHMCDQCGKRFKLKWALTLHRRAHSKNRPNQCTTCHKSFVHSKDLVRHELIHAETKGFRCGICSTTFKRKDNLNRHARNTHPGKKPQIIKCIDNPNAIKVITAQPAVIKHANQDDDIPFTSVVNNPDSPKQTRQQLNVPLKLAFKTPSFKNNYNINRDYVASQEERVSIYEKIMMPRSPGTRISSTTRVEKDQEESNIICQKILGPFNAPSHYETSFDNTKHAVIKNIKFKLPDNYTNLNSRDSIITMNDIINHDTNASKKYQNLKGDSIIDDNKSIVNNVFPSDAAPSVIVNSSSNQVHSRAIHDSGFNVSHNQMTDVHWRKRTSQFVTAD